MSRLGYAISMLGLAGCDFVFGADFDVDVDAPLPVIAQFGEPVRLPGMANTGGEDDDPSLTGDLRELYLLRDGDLYVSKRDGDVPWPLPEPIVEVNTPATEMRPAVSRDGLTLYFTRSVGTHRDIYFSTRFDRMSPWSEAEVVPLDLNAEGSHEYAAWSSSDGLTLIVTRETGDTSDLFLATRDSTMNAFTSVPFDGINFDSKEGGGWATDDFERVLFESNRSGDMEIWEAARYGASWHVERHLALSSMTGVKNDGTPWISPDGTTVVFSTNRDGDDDLYIATREAR